ncbi:MAG: hypothetical protein ACRDGI_06815 [Candidatus Limnocylindrales bacterium]
MLLAAVDVDAVEQVADPCHPRVEPGVLDKPAHLVDRVADQLWRDRHRLLDLLDPLQAGVGLDELAGDGLDLELDPLGGARGCGPQGAAQVGVRALEAAHRAARLFEIRVLPRRP